MARCEKVGFGPKLGLGLYLGTNDIIIDFGRAFHADSENVGQQILLCAVWPLGGFKVAIFKQKIAVISRGIDELGQNLCIGVFEVDASTKDI